MVLIGLFFGGLVAHYGTGDLSPQIQIIGSRFVAQKHETIL